MAVAVVAVMGGFGMVRHQLCGGKKRYGSSGGTHREYYSRYYKAKGSGRHRLMF